jgi:hypothetical protein
MVEEGHGDNPRAVGGGEVEKKLCTTWRQFFIACMLSIVLRRGNFHTSVANKDDVWGS